MREKHLATVLLILIAPAIFAANKETSKEQTQEITSRSEEIGVISVTGDVKGSFTIVRNISDFTFTNHKERNPEAEKFNITIKIKKSKASVKMECYEDFNIASKPDETHILERDEEASCKKTNRVIIFPNKNEQEVSGSYSIKMEPPDDKKP